MPPKSSYLRKKRTKQLESPMRVRWNSLQPLRRKNKLLKVTLRSNKDVVRNSKDSNSHSITISLNALR